jgi:hypothetical protein
MVLLHNRFLKSGLGIRAVVGYVALGGRDHIVFALTIETVSFAVASDEEERGARTSAAARPAGGDEHGVAAEKESVGAEVDHLVLLEVGVDDELAQRAEV